MWVLVDCIKHLLVEAHSLTSLLLSSNISIEVGLSGCSVRKAWQFLLTIIPGKRFFFFSLSGFPTRILFVAQPLCGAGTAHCIVRDGVQKPLYKVFGSHWEILPMPVFSLPFCSIEPMPSTALSPQSCLPAGRAKRSFAENHIVTRS